MKIAFVFAVLLVTLSMAYAIHDNGLFINSWTRYDSASIKKLIIEIDGNIGLRPFLTENPGGHFNDAVCLTRIDKSIATLFSEGFDGEILPGGITLCDDGKSYPIGDTPAHVSFPISVSMECPMGYHEGNIFELATYLDARTPPPRDTHFRPAEYDDDFFPKATFTQHQAAKKLSGSDYKPSGYAGLGISYNRTDGAYLDPENDVFPTSKLCVKNDAPLRFVRANPRDAYLGSPVRNGHFAPPEVGMVCNQNFGANYRAASAGTVAAAMKGAFEADASMLLLSQGIYIVTVDQTVGGLFPSMIDVRTQCAAYYGKFDPFLSLVDGNICSLGAEKTIYDDLCSAGSYALDAFPYLFQTSNGVFTSVTSCDNELFSKLMSVDSDLSMNIESWEYPAETFDSSRFHVNLDDRTGDDCQSYPRLATLDVPPLMGYMQRTTFDVPFACGITGGVSSPLYAGVCGYPEDDFDDLNNMYVACVREDNNLAQDINEIDYIEDTEWLGAPFSSGPSMFGSGVGYPFASGVGGEGIYLPNCDFADCSDPEPWKLFAAEYGMAYGPNEAWNVPNDYYHHGLGFQLMRPYEDTSILSVSMHAGSCPRYVWGDQSPLWAGLSPLNYAYVCIQGSGIPGYTFSPSCGCGDWDGAQPCCDPLTSCD